MKVVNETILIVEDNVGLNELLSEKVHDCGYETYSVYSAVQAFEWLEGNKALLVLLDYSLPDMNGKEFIELLIAESFPLPPFIVATGQGDERIAVQMMKLGARDYVVKDSNFLELMPLIISKVSAEIKKEQKIQLIENELAESNQFNKQIIKGAQEGIVVYDLDLKYQVWNPFMERITGVQSKDILGKYIFDVFPFLDKTDMFEKLKQALKGGQSSEIEFYFTIPETGKSAWVSETVASLRNAENQVTGAIAAVHDITERKNAERSLVESEEKYRVLVENAGIGVALYSIDGKILFFNDKAVQNMGGRAEDYIGKYLYEFFDEVSANEYMNRIKLAINSEKSIEFEDNVTLKSGSYWFLSNHSKLLNKDGGLIGVQVLAHDITERKIAEKQIEKIGQHYQALIENAPDGFVLLNTDGQFKYVSPSGRRIFGYDESDEIYAHPNDLTHPDDLPMVLSHLAKLMENPDYTPKIEYRFASKTGAWIWIESTFSNLLADPNVESIVINFRDITERKNAEFVIQENRNMLHKLLFTSSELIEPASNKIDYERITDIARELSGAKYASFNIFDENGRDFKTVAFSGLSDFQQKALDLFGFEIINKKWDYDPIREARIKDNTITEFDSLEALAHNHLPKSVFNKIKKIYTFGKVAVVKITKNNKNVGDFTLLMKEGVGIKNPEILELFANQVGLFIERQLSEEKLRKSEEKFRILFAENPQPMFVYDVETLEILEVNQTALDFYGYSKKDFLSLTVERLHPLEELPIFMKTIEQTRAGINTDGVSNHVKKNGEKIMVDVITVPATTISANARHVLVIDITERKLAEEALTQKMEELMRFHHLTVGREHTMIELKKEINRLLVKFGEKEKYKIVE